MDTVKVIEIKKSVYESNDREADKLRAELKDKGIFLLNLMSSPGSGKTTTLKATINRMKYTHNIGVMEADIDSDVDAIAIAKDTGVKSIQLHTGGMCHLDAGMTRQGLDELIDGKVDFAILENVGNLVCPAEFDTGATKNALNAHGRALHEIRGKRIFERPWNLDLEIRVAFAHEQLCRRLAAVDVAQ